MTFHRYRAYGLEIASEVEFPEFARGRDGEAAVTVEVGPIGAARDEHGTVSFRNWTAEPGFLDLEVPGVARLRVEAGTRIRVEPAQGRTPEDAVSHIQGSGFAALLQQRGIASMHAGTFETDLGAILITGPSGGGKSTLLNAMVARGFRMLADDVTPVTIDGTGRPIANAAFPASRLWRDSAERMGHDVNQLGRVNDGFDKYYVRIPGFREEPQPIAAVVVIAITAQGLPRLAELAPSERIESLVRFTYRKNFLHDQRLRELQFATVSALATKTWVVKLSRPALDAEPDEIAATIVAALGCEPVNTGRVTAAA